MCGGGGGIKTKYIINNKITAVGSYKNVYKVAEHFSTLSVQRSMFLLMFKLGGTTLKCLSQ